MDNVIYITKEGNFFEDGNEILKELEFYKAQGYCFQKITAKSREKERRKNVMKKFFYEGRNPEWRKCLLEEEFYSYSRCCPKDMDEIVYMAIVYDIGKSKKYLFSVIELYKFIREHKFRGDDVIKLWESVRKKNENYIRYINLLYKRGIDSPFRRPLQCAGHHEFWEGWENFGLPSPRKTKTSSFYHFRKDVYKGVQYLFNPFTTEIYI